jgi:CBS domain-containing protein
MHVERVPIRHIHRVGRDGKRARALSVYCPFRGRSFDADHCGTCPRRVTSADDPDAPGAFMVCASEDEPVLATAAAIYVGSRRPHGHFDEIARDAPIGVVMAPSLVIVHRDAALDALRDELEAKTGRVLPVVADDDRLLGVITADHLAPPPPAPESRPDLRELLSLLAPSTVRDVMTAHVVAFPESGRVVDALDAMITERVRYLPIVRADGVVIGIVWDLNILSWLARAQRPDAAGSP